MNSNEHSFYREAKKSFLSQEEFSWKRFFKRLTKYLKILLYMFLVMVTLWGCVNQFRHSTSGSVSQGLEFYQGYDTVLPNLYDGVQNSETYQITKVTQDDEGKDVESLAPLEFYTMNPNYGATDVPEGSTANTDDLFVKLSDVTDIQGNQKIYPFAYSANYDLAKLALFRYDWTPYVDSTIDISQNVGKAGYVGWTLPWISLPPGITDQGINNLTDLYYDIFGNDAAENDKTKSLFQDGDYDGNGQIDEGEKVAVPITQAYIVPNESMYSEGAWNWDNGDNWEVITGFNVENPTQSQWDTLSTEDQDTIINNQIMFFTNSASFLMGRSVSSSEKLSSLDDKSIQNVVLESFDRSDNNSGTVYTADFKPLYEADTLYSYRDNDESSDFEKGEYSTYNFYKGTGYSIQRQAKESPLYPSQQAISTFKNDQNGDFRDANWYEGTEAGTQERTDKAGWVILNNTGDLITLNPMDSSKNDVYLYGNTEDEFNDNVLSYRSPYFSQGKEVSRKDGYYVETTINFSPGIRGNEPITIDYNSYFIGMLWGSSSSNSGSSVPKGVTATPQDAIAASGQSSTNEGRDIFAASWSDWGDSWDPDYGPMYGMFVYPLAQFSLIVNSWFPYTTFGVWGVLLGIFIITFALRGLGLLMSVGSSKNQHKMQEIQPLVAEINAKYAMYDKSDKQMKQRKQMETMALYKKHEVNPFSSIGTLFITLPIFLSLFTIISAIPIYKTASLGVFSFSVSSFYGMFNVPSMFFAYALVGISVGFSQAVSSKLPGWLSNKRRGIKQVDEATKEAMKKQKRTQNILVGVFVFIGLTVSVLLAIYWIFSALFTITNELVRHGIQQQKAKKVKSKPQKNEL